MTDIEVNHVFTSESHSGQRKEGFNLYCFTWDLIGEKDLFWETLCRQYPQHYTIVTLKINVSYIFF